MFDQVLYQAVTQEALFDHSEEIFLLLLLLFSTQQFSVSWAPPCTKIQVCPGAEGEEAEGVDEGEATTMEEVTLKQVNETFDV